MFGRIQNSPDSFKIFAVNSVSSILLIAVEVLLRRNGMNKTAQRYFLSQCFVGIKRLLGVKSAKKRFVGELGIHIGIIAFGYISANKFSPVYALVYTPKLHPSFYSVAAAFGYNIVIISKRKAAQSSPSGNQGYVVSHRIRREIPCFPAVYIRNVAVRGRLYIPAYDFIAGQSGIHSVRFFNFRAALACILYIIVIARSASVEVQHRFVHIACIGNFFPLLVVDKLAARKQHTDAYNQNNN